MCWCSLTSEKYLMMYMGWIIRTGQHWVSKCGTSYNAPSWIMRHSYTCLPCWHKFSWDNITCQSNEHIEGVLRKLLFAYQALHYRFPLYVNIPPLVPGRLGDLLKVICPRQTKLTTRKKIGTCLDQSGTSIFHDGEFNYLKAIYTYKRVPKARKWVIKQSSHQSRGS